MRKFPMIAAALLTATASIPSVSAQETTGTTTTIDDDADDDGYSEGLWGLLGLIGLAGLMKRKRHDNIRH